MPKYIIGLTGKKTSGKSTAAAYLVEKWKFKEFSFADPLKRGLVEMFGLARESLYGSETQKSAPDPYWGVSGRRLAQVVGSELFRETLPTLLPEMYNVWIRNMERILIETDEWVVISDVRFEDEANLIRAHGGIIIQINRDTVSNTDQHSSENQTFKVDAIIENKTLLDFYKNLDNSCSFLS